MHNSAFEVCLLLLFDVLVFRSVATDVQARVQVMASQLAPVDFSPEKATAKDETNSAQNMRTCA